MRVLVEIWRRWRFSHTGHCNHRWVETNGKAGRQLICIRCSANALDHSDTSRRSSP
jgi:hypothetical protein